MRRKRNYRLINRMRNEQELLARGGKRAALPPPEQPRIILPPVINTKWNLKVPKILHVYWDSGLLPYIRYMTVKTFLRFNPDWEVVLWTPKYPSLGAKWKTKEHDYVLNCSNMWGDLLKLPITINEVDFLRYGLSNDIPEVHKSDFLRTHILSTIGGVWSDMDILYLSSIINLRVNVEENKNIDTFVCISHYGHSIGFMMAAPDNKFFKSLINPALREYNSKQYQCIGSVLYNKYGRSIEELNKITTATNIDMEAIYLYDGRNISLLMSPGESNFPLNSIGVHWYAGYNKWGEFINKTNGGITNLPNTIIGNVLRKLNEII